MRSASMIKALANAGKPSIIPRAAVGEGLIERRLCLSMKPDREPDQGWRASVLQALNFVRQRLAHRNSLL